MSLRERKCVSQIRRWVKVTVFIEYVQSMNLVDAPLLGKKYILFKMLLVLLLLFWMLNLKCRTVFVMVMMIGCCTKTEVRICLLWSLTFLWVLCHCSTWFDDCMLMCCNAMLLALVDWLVIEWFDHGCLACVIFMLMLGL